MNFPEIIAIAISLFALGWNVYRDCINVGKLKVDAYIADVFFPGKPPLPQVISVTVTNTGLKARIVNGHCFLIASGKQLIFPEIISEFSKVKLEPGECLSVAIPNPCLQNLIEQANDLKGFCIGDTLGQKWYLPRKKFEELVGNFKKQMVEDI